MDPCDTNNEIQLHQFTSEQCERMIIDLNDLLKRVIVTSTKPPEDLCVYFLDPLRRFGYQHIKDEAPMSLEHLVYEINVAILKETFLNSKIQLDEAEYLTLRSITTPIKWISEKPFSMSQIFNIVHKTDQQKLNDGPNSFSSWNVLSILAAFVQHFGDSTTTADFVSNIILFGVYLVDSMSKAMNKMCAFWNNLLKIYYNTPEFADLVAKYPELSILRKVYGAQNTTCSPASFSHQLLAQLNSIPQQAISGSQLIHPSLNSNQDRLTAEVIDVLKNPQHPLYWQIFSMFQTVQNNTVVLKPIPQVPQIPQIQPFSLNQNGMFPTSYNFATNSIFPPIAPLLQNAPSVSEDQIFKTPFSPNFHRERMRSETPGIPVVMRYHPIRPSTAGPSKQKALFPVHIQQILHERFEKSHYISDGEVRELLKNNQGYGIEISQVKNWFTNQRNKFKRDLKSTMKKDQITQQ